MREHRDGQHEQDVESSSLHGFSVDDRKVYTTIPVWSSIARPLCCAIVAACGLLVEAPAAHKSVVSRYTFHRDVAPILRDRCGSCHVEGGNAAPLLTYAEAKADAWWIQQVVLSGRMPVWYADPLAAPFKGSRALSAREIDIITTWAAGNTPEGAPVGNPAEPAAAHRPAPDVVLEMPSAFTLTASQRTAVREIVWPAGRLAGRWVQMADVLPGSASIVRGATIEIRSSAGRQVITHWVPGDTPESLPGGGAFRVPRGASVVMRMQYAQPSRQPQTISDRSRVAFYLLSQDKARPVEEISVTGEGRWLYAEPEIFLRPIGSRVEIVAIRPVGGSLDGQVTLTVVAPGGQRRPLASATLRPEWPRRYIFETPIVVEAGSQIEARVTPSFGAAWSSLTGDRDPAQGAGGPLRVVVESIR
jgi:hypothetical protein